MNVMGGGRVTVGVNVLGVGDESTLGVYYVYALCV